jgi:hypothetical protein
MRYDDRPEIDATYAEIASLYERHEDAEPAMALTMGWNARREAGPHSISTCREPTHQRPYRATTS